MTALERAAKAYDVAHRAAEEALARAEQLERDFNAAQAESRRLHNIAFDAQQELLQAASPTTPIPGALVDASF